VELKPTEARPPSGAPDAALITSASVARFVPDLAARLGAARVVAVGPQTAGALHKLGVHVDGVGRAGGVEALDLLNPAEGEDAWYVGARAPSAALLKALDEKGFRRWSVYDTVVPVGLKERLRHHPYDMVVFTSGSAVRAYVDAMGAPSVPVAVLGQTTSMEAAALGVKVTRVAAEPTLAALAATVAEMVRWAEGSSTGPD